MDGYHAAVDEARTQARMWSERMAVVRDRALGVHRAVRWTRALYAFGCDVVLIVWHDGSTAQPLTEGQHGNGLPAAG